MTDREPRWLLWTGAGLALWAAGHMLAVVVTYQLYPGYMELNEASLVIMAKFLLSGEPVYRGLDSPDRVTHVHGPLTFLWTAWPQILFGSGVGAGRLAATLASLALPAVMIATHWRKGAVAVLMALCFAVFGLLVHLNLSIVVRPDMPIAVLVALAVWAAAWGERGGGLAASAAIGVCAGLLVGFKVNAALCLVPVVLYHISGGWIGRTLVVGVPALALVLAPWALPVFPLEHFLAMLPVVAGKENTWFAFTSLWWKFALYALVPPALWLMAGRGALAAMDGRLKLYLATYVGAVVLMLYPATKTGAGHYYFLPFVAVMADLSLRALAAGGAVAARRKAALVVTMAVMLGACWQPERRFFKALDWDEARSATKEIGRILADHPGKTIQMGLGGVVVGDPLTVRFYAYRSLLVEVGNPYTLDFNTVMDMAKMRVPFPAAVFHRLETCHTDLWLVPKDERPFSLNGYYYEPVFGERFRRTFVDTHRKVASYGIFDVYACEGPIPGL